MRRTALVALFTLLLATNLEGGTRRGERFTGSAEFASSSFRGMLIKNYTDLTGGYGPNWAWIRSGRRVSNYNIKVGNFRDLTGRNASIAKILSELNDEFTRHQDEDRPTLWVEAVLYRVVPQGKSNPGGGVELIFRDGKKVQIAKVRHFEAGEPRDAADDMIDVLEEFCDEN